MYFTFLIEPTTSPSHLDPHFTPVLSLTGKCRDFVLVPWTDFRIISVQVNPKAIFSSISGIEKYVMLKN